MTLMAAGIGVPIQFRRPRVSPARMRSGPDVAAIEDTEARCSPELTDQRAKDRTHSVRRSCVPRH
jgi:hypothetical protein